jgi:hypothetical protein
VVEITGWYEHGQQLALASRDDVDRLLDKMAADTANHDVPVMAQADRRDADGWAILQFGLGPAAGFVGYMGQAGSAISDNGKASADEVVYDYMGHQRDVPAAAEVPPEDVRRAVREFVRTGGQRPDGITWRDL